MATSLPVISAGRKSVIEAGADAVVVVAADELAMEWE